MFKPGLYYLVGGAAVVGGPAVGYDLIRRGRQASAIDHHLRDNANERLLLEDEIHTQEHRDKAKAAGIAPDTVRRHYNQLRDAGETQTPSALNEGPMRPDADYQ